MIEKYKLKADMRILNTAIRYYWEDIVNYLLSENLVSFDDGSILRPLKLATRNSQLRIIKKLVDNGAETNASLLGYCQSLDIVKWYLVSGKIVLTEDNLWQVLTNDQADIVLFSKYWFYWTQLRLLFIGKSDSGSTLHPLPIEVIKHIANCFKYFV